MRLSEKNEKELNGMFTKASLLGCMLAVINIIIIVAAVGAIFYLFKVIFMS